MFRSGYNRAPAKRRLAQPAAALCLIAVLTTPGCMQRKTAARVFVPPPAIIRTAPAQVDPLEVALGLPSPPEIIEEIPSVSLDIKPVFPPQPPPVAAASKPAAPKAAAPEPAPVTVPTPAPRPAAIVTADERRRLEQEYEDRVNRVKRVLMRIEGRTLPEDLAKMANDARVYLAQAEQEHSRDLPSAVSWATRADLFATDLSTRLRF